MFKAKSLRKQNNQDLYAMFTAYIEAIIGAYNCNNILYTYVMKYVTKGMPNAAMFSFNFKNNNT